MSVRVGRKAWYAQHHLLLASIKFVREAVAIAGMSVTLLCTHNYIELYLVTDFSCTVT